jgi:hypothetical protein
MAATTLGATLAFRSATWKKTLLWWIVTGLLAGASVMLRPDSGLFALGIGLAIVAVELFSPGEKLSARLLGAGWKGAAFSIAFIVVLLPWTIRNYEVFELFQPLSPAHAEMPGEFVAHGYNRWLRTWVDDSRYVETTLWNLDEKRISINKLPRTAFDSDDERAKVAFLLQQYNHPPGSEQEPSANEPDSSGGVDSNSESNDDTGSADSNDDSVDSDTDGDNSPEEVDEDDDEEASDVLMTPEIDGEFALIADARIARSPARYYFWLPIKRAAALWFDSHSRYYPFGGQISPVRDLDADESQQYWLPAFLAVLWLYTLLAVGGVSLSGEIPIDRVLCDG